MEVGVAKPEAYLLLKIEKLELELQSQLQELRNVLKEDRLPLEIDVEAENKTETDKTPTTCLKLHANVAVWRDRNAAKLKLLFWLLLTVGFLTYFCYAMYYRFGDDGSIILLVIVIFVIAKTLISVVWSKWAKHKSRELRKRLPTSSKTIKKIRFILFSTLFVIVMIYVIVDVAMVDPSNLISLLGIFIFVFGTLATSRSPGKVKWRIVIVGLLLQIVIALVILRTQSGVTTFRWIGDRVTEFLKHADAGSRFVFGDSYRDHFIAFVIMPVVVFMSSTIAILYYLGAMQWIITRFSWVIQVTMGTTAGESVIAAGNIFFGSAEAPLLIKPLLAKLTSSELHAVMTSGFATISGAVLAVYIIMGVRANHLLSASIMSAPAALAMAKLSFPETGRSKLSARDVRKSMGTSEERTVLEAVSNGAVVAIPLIAGIIVNLIAFVAILDLLDQTLYWFGDRVGLTPPLYPALSVRLISSYTLWPVAFIMGVDVADCRKVASLLGIRAFLSEFISYQELGVVMNNRRFLVESNYTGRVVNNGDDLVLLDLGNKTLKYGIMAEKSEVIATYALCGFAGCIGLSIMLGVMNAAVPSCKADISRFAVRAVVCGTVACYLTASIAGLLFKPEDGYEQ